MNRGTGGIGPPVPENHRRDRPRCLENPKPPCRKCLTCNRESTGLGANCAAYPGFPLSLRSGAILGYYRWPLRGQIVRIKGQMCESGARSCESGARSCEVLRLVPLETDSAHYII